jgi:PIN domain nuclease of toxin-antitoxin system
VRTGKLEFANPPGDWLREQMALLNVTQLPVRADHALKTLTLPMHHRDPFDRMLVSQAIVDQLPLMTNDRAINRYDVETIW